MDKNIMYVISFFLGILILYLLKDYCGCNNVVEGQAVTGGEKPCKGYAPHRRLQAGVVPTVNHFVDQSEIDKCITCINPYISGEVFRPRSKISVYCVINVGLTRKTCITIRNFLGKVLEI